MRKVKISGLFILTKLLEVRDIFYHMTSEMLTIIRKIIEHIVHTYNYTDKFSIISFSRLLDDSRRELINYKLRLSSWRDMQVFSNYA